MKNKIKFLGPISAFVLIVVFVISTKSFANTEELKNIKCDTELCDYFLGDGSMLQGARCYPPSSTGPCDKQTNCII